MALGKFLLDGPRKRRSLMGEVPLFFMGEVPLFLMGEVLLLKFL
jgi:hypothetical protein